jgi:hypothetical protein
VLLRQARASCAMNVIFHKLLKKYQVHRSFDWFGSRSARRRTVREVRQKTSPLQKCYCTRLEYVRKLFM